MRKNINFVLAALLAASFTTLGAAHAGGNGNNGNGGGNGNAGGNAGGQSADKGSMSANAGGAMGAEKGKKDKAMMNYGQVISGLRSSSKRAASALPEIADTDTVSIILLSDLKGQAAGNAAALDKALNAESLWIANLRSDIDANPALTDALTAEGYATANVVAVSTSGDGTVVLIVDDRT